MTNLWNHVRTVMNSHAVHEKTLVSIFDLDGNLYSINQEMRKMLDIPRTDNNKNIFEYLEAADASELRRIIDKTLESKTCSSKLNFQNGSPHLVNLNVHAVPVVVKSKQYFVCLGEEIKTTPEPMTPKTVDSSKPSKNIVSTDQHGLFQSAMDNSPALSWMIDEEENLVYANRAYKKFFSLPADAIGQYIGKYIPPNVIQSLYEKHKDSFYANKPCSSIEKAFLADGTCLEFKVMLFPALNSLGGKVITGQAVILPLQQNDQPATLHPEKSELLPELTETIMNVLEKERTRIGYELHDNINQILTTVNLFIGQLQVKTGEQEKLKDKSMEYLVNAIEEIRSLSKGLVTPQLKEKGLVESIEAMVCDFSVAGTMRIHFTHDCSVEHLAHGKTLTLFRVVQEQLKNISKYSGASVVAINLASANDQVTVTISDNGKGFDPAQTTRGIGLSNIYERTRFYGGTVLIDTSPGAGCTLIVKIPAE